MSEPQLANSLQGASERPTIVDQIHHYYWGLKTNGHILAILIIIESLAGPNSGPSGPLYGL